MTWPDRISVYHRLQRKPDPSCDSFGLDVMILSERHQRVAARLVEDLVVYDYRQGIKTGLRGFMIDQFQQTWSAQQIAQTTNEGRIKDLLMRVENLEKISWDRDGAQEDLGNR